MNSPGNSIFYMTLDGRSRGLLNNFLLSLLFRVFLCSLIFSAITSLKGLENRCQLAVLFCFFK